MVKNRIKMYWLLLLVLIYSMFAVFSVGETQARYVNTVTWDTVLGETEDQLSSNLLRDISDPPVTILLGEMTQNVLEVPILLKSGVDVEGDFTWYVSPENDQNYLSVEMRVGSTPLSMDGEQDPMQLRADEPVTVTMRLIPNASAFTTAHEAVSVTITVFWGNTLTGTFLAEFPEVVSEPVQQINEDLDPTVVQQEETMTAETLSADENTASEADSVESNSKTSEPALENAETTEEGSTEPSEPDTSTEGSTEPETSGSGEAEDPGTEPQEPPLEGGSGDPSIPDSGDNTEPSDPDEDENTGEDPEPDDPNEDTPPEEEVVVQEIHIQTVESDVFSEQLILQIDLPEGTTKMRLGMGNSGMRAVNNTDTWALDVFPAYLCYSYDNGKSYYMLYNSDIIELNTEGLTAIQVLVDFSKTKMTEETEMVLAITAHAGQNIVGTGMNTVTVEKTQSVHLSSRFLTKGSSLSIEIPKEWQAHTLEYVVEMLTADETTGKIGYVPVDLKTSGMKITADAKTGVMTIQTDKTLPAAGSYRITMNWMSEGVCVIQAQENFFVHYLNYMDTIKTGGAVQ